MLRSRIRALFNVYKAEIQKIKDTEGFFERMEESVNKYSNTDELAYGDNEILKIYFEKIKYNKQPTYWSKFSQDTEYEKAVEHFVLSQVALQKLSNTTGKRLGDMGLSGESFVDEIATVYPNKFGIDELITAIISSEFKIDYNTDKTIQTIAAGKKTEVGRREELIKKYHQKILG